MIEQRKETQLRLIRQHLESGRGISQLYALHKFGCMRLASRINDLRNRGMNITTTMVTDGDKRYARYTLKN